MAEYRQSVYIIHADLSSIQCDTSQTRITPFQLGNYASISTHVWLSDRRSGSRMRVPRSRTKEVR